MTPAIAPLPGSPARPLAAIAAPAQLPALIDHGPFGAIVAVSAESDAPEHEVRRAYETLFKWAPRAARAYSAQTCEAWRLDWKAFSRFCLTRGLQPLPAKPETVCAFIAWRMGLAKKPATIVRTIATIARAHRAAGVANPCEAEEVRLSKRAMYRELGARQDQARGLLWAEIQRFLELPILTFRDHRDRALVAVAYDSMGRSEEIVALDVKHFEWMPDGSGVVLIKRAKNDPEGKGAKTYVSSLTVKLMKTWLSASGITTGAVFRVVRGNRALGARLRPAAIHERIQRVGEWIGLSVSEWKALSGHSTRVGAAQDLGALNEELPGVMQAGRWKDPRSALRYLENILASRGAMARAAKAQGRA